MLQKLLGKATWLKLKRELTEDAKKIWIVAPIPRKYNKKVKAIEDGEEIEKIETVKRLKAIGADINIPLKRVNIAINRIIFAGENMSNKLYIKLLTTVVRYP